MISIKSKLDFIKNKFVSKEPEYTFKNPKKEFLEVIQPRRYKIPIFGNLGENNCLFVDCLFVSKYNKKEKFNRKTQWKKREPIKFYANLVAKNENSKVLFDILEQLKFSKNNKAKNILVEHCVSQLRDEIEEVKLKSKLLHKILQRTDINRQKKQIRIAIFLSFICLVALVLCGIYEFK